MITKQTCVILVPHTSSGIEPECAKGLESLEARGFEVRRKSLGIIDFARSIMASQAMNDGFEQMMWIDSDVGFDPEDVLKLRAHRLPIVSGIYAKKGERAIASNLLPTTKQVLFGKGGGVFEIAYAAAGFTFVQAEVYKKLAEILPLCNETFGVAFYPFYLPMIGEDRGKPWYMGEDFAFCERAKRAGYQIHADSSIRLRHYGKYGYAWEDSGGSLERHESYLFNVIEGPPPPKR